MTKDKYFFMTIGMAIIVAGLFGYSYHQNLNPIEEENYIPPAGEEILKDKGINGETSKNAAESGIEGLEGELAGELDGFSNDIADIEAFNEDTSLDDLNTDLTGIGE